MAQDFLTAAEAASPRRIHLIGVAGSGMSGIASLLLDLGFKVTHHGETGKNWFGVGQEAKMREMRAERGRLAFGKA